MACSKSGLTNTNTRSICCFVASTRKKKHYTTTFPKPCPKLNMSLGKTRSTAYESCTLKENRTELYCPFRRIFLSGLTLICCHQSAAIASTLQSGQVGNQSSVRYKGKEWSIILPDLYQRVAMYSSKEGSRNSCENCGAAGGNVSISKSESPLLARFIFTLHCKN